MYFREEKDFVEVVVVTSRSLPLVGLTTRIVNFTKRSNSWDIS